MSQLRLMHRVLRALIASMGACALLAALMTIPSASADAKNGRMMGECHRSMTTAALGEDSPRPSPHNHAHCPNCCTAAASAPITMPEREVGQWSPLRMTMRRVIYVVQARAEPKAVASRSINGARAPPA